MDSPLLTFGDMLTFVGLIIAAISLMKPQNQLIWRLSSTPLKFLTILVLILGYLSPLIGVIFGDTLIFWRNLTLHQYIETSGFVLISTGLLMVWFIFSKYNSRNMLFVYPKYTFHFQKYPKRKWRSISLQVERQNILSTKSAEKFYRTTSLFLFRGHIAEVVEIIRYNIRPLVSSARKLDLYREVDDNTKNQINGSNFAFESLYQILTDKQIMDHIVTTNKFFIHEIVEAEVDSSLTYMRSEFGNVLYSNLLESLISNTNSILYTQKESDTGTARFANIYNLLIKSGVVKRQRIIPGQLTWKMRKSNVPLDQYTDILLKLTEKMVDAYKQAPGNIELLNNIKFALLELAGSSGILKSLAYDSNERKRNKENNTESISSRIFSNIEISITLNMLPRPDDPEIFLKDKNELKAVNTESIYDQRTLTGLLSHIVFSILEDLTVFYRDHDNGDELIRHEMLSYLDHFSDTELSNHYKSLVWERLFDKAVFGKLEIGANIDGSYPNVLPVIIDFLVPFHFIRNEIEINQVEKLKELMSGKLKEVLLAGKTMRGGKPMLEELLPRRVTARINKSKKDVKYYHSNSKLKTTFIDLTPSDAVQLDRNKS